jgi:phosphopantothenoylcysteine decarboxylase/phosphopantothenate--cysteine ligase
MGQKSDLNGRHIVVTAGGTHEPIDPVRYISNRSSGKMGYAIAEAARYRGAQVSLITTTILAEPAGIDITQVETALEMKTVVAQVVKDADALIMAAAVADYRPKSFAKAKIKKESSSLTLELIRTPDILTEVKGNFIRVGFAAETEDLLANAQKKLKEKQLDLIVANNITDKESGFGVNTNKVIMISRNGRVKDLPLLTKREVADKVLDRVVGLLNKRS